MTYNLSTTELACLGDIMLELITQKAEPLANYQRTVVLDERENTIGGSVFNIAWYFSQLGANC